MEEQTNTNIPCGKLKLRDIYNEETRKGVLRYLSYLWVRYNNKKRDEEKKLGKFNPSMDVDDSQ